MLEILLVAIWAIALAKHPQRRRRYSLKRVRTTAELALGTLASDTASVVTVVGTTDMAHRCISIKATWAMTSLTGGDGPITVGYAHGDYTVAEIKEALEATGAIAFSNKIQEEQANRLVRIVGSFSGTGASVLNDGKPIKTRLNWLIPTGEQVNIFAFNEGTSPLTAGGSVNVQGDYYATKGT